MTGQAVPFTLAAFGVSRETAAGWRRWRLTRSDFVAAPRMSLAAWRRLSSRDRTLYDLHRAATNANLPIQETPMSVSVAKVMWSRIQNNALKQQPTTRAGLMITGGGYQGKTETACEVAAAFEDQWLALHHHLNPDAVPGTRDLLAPVAYVQTPVTATPKSVCEAILDFYGAPSAKLTLPQLVQTVRASLYEHATRVLILDDISRLRMHRESDQDALDLLRSLMSMHVTLVLIGVGIPQSGLLGEGHQRGHLDQAATQTQRRFDLVELGPFRYDTPQETAAWVTHLAGIEAHLRLLRRTPGMLTSGTMPEYLFRRTSGIVGLLERLVEDGCTEAINTGAEHLTSDLLDGIDINLGNLPGRDQHAGEVPKIPAHQSRKTTGKRRNTVFDDHGRSEANKATK